MGQKAGQSGDRRAAGRTASGVPVIGHQPGVGRPQVGVLRQTVSRSSSDNPVQPPHVHDFPQIIYVEHGQHRCRVGHRTWTLAAGDLLLIASGAVIDTAALETVDGTTTWTVFFALDAADLATTTSAVASWAASTLLAPFSSRNEDAQLVHTAPADRTEVTAQLSHLSEELTSMSTGYLMAVRAHLTLLLVRLGRLTADGIPIDRDDSVLAAVFDTIESSYNQRISLDVIAATVSLSSGHLNKLVKRDTGRTIGQWITERRLREARRLLANTTLDVAQIATRVGYPDPGYFSRRFREHHNTTPRDWRRLNLEIEQQGHTAAAAAGE